MQQVNVGVGLHQHLFTHSMNQCEHVTPCFVVTNTSNNRVAANAFELHIVFVYGIVWQNTIVEKQMSNVIAIRIV